MLLMRTSLVREGEEGKGKQMGRSTMRDLIRDYRLAGAHADWRSGPTPPDRPDPGRAAIACPLRGQRHRDGALAQVQAGDGQCHRVTEFQAKDVLLIDMSDPEVDVREFCSEARLEPMILRGSISPIRRGRWAWRRSPSSPAPGCSARASAR